MMQLNGRGECVFNSKTFLGQEQKVYIMYHGTSPDNALCILKEGFKPSTVTSTVHGMLLGQGVYVSRDMSKAIRYGKVVLKLLVYTGRTCKVETSNVTIRSTWQLTHDSAWIPPRCGNPLAPSGLEETCVKDPGNILVLGVVMGQHLIVQGEGFQCFEGGHKLLPTEEVELRKFTENLKLGYFYLKNISTGKILCVEPSSRSCRLEESLSKSSCTCYALWTWLRDSTTVLQEDDSQSGARRTGSLCNKLSDRVLTIKPEKEGLWLGAVTCYMADYGINYPTWTQNTMQCQVLTAGPGGELLHRASGQFLTITRDANNNQGWIGLGHARDYWQVVYCGLCPVCDS